MTNKCTNCDTGTCVVRSIFYSFNRNVVCSALQWWWDRVNYRTGIHWCYSEEYILVPVVAQRAKSKKQPTNDTWDRFITGTIVWSDCHSPCGCTQYYYGQSEKRDQELLGTITASRKRGTTGYCWFELERERFIYIFAIYHDNCMWVGDFYQYSPSIHDEYKTVNWRGNSCIRNQECFCSLPRWITLLRTVGHSRWTNERSRGKWTTGKKVYGVCVCVCVLKLHFYSLYR